MTDYHTTIHTSYPIEHQNCPILLDTSETPKYVASMDNCIWSFSIKDFEKIMLIYSMKTGVISMTEPSFLDTRLLAPTFKESLFQSEMKTSGCPIKDALRLALY